MTRWIAPLEPARAPSVIDESQHRLVAVEARITHESTSDTPLRNRFTDWSRPVTTTDLADVCLGNAPSLPPASLSSDLLPAADLGRDVVLVDALLATLYNGAGRYELALVAAQRANESLQEFGFSMLVLPELIEAASRCGMKEQGLAAFTELRGGDQARAEQTGRWGLRHVQGRSRLATTLPTASTAMRSVTSLGHGRRWSWRVPDCSTANGCVESIGGETHESIFVQRMRCFVEMGASTFAETRAP